MPTFKDPTYRGSQFLQSILASVGLDASDPMAVVRAQDALTDAQAWIWQQHDWYWAVSPKSPARFEIFPKTTVVVDSSSTTLSVADTGDFVAGDTIIVDESGSKEEYATISAVTKNQSFTLKAALESSHDADDAAEVRKLRPVVPDAKVRTRIDASSSAQTVNVQHTQNFSAGDIIVIDPGGPNEEVKVIASVTGTTGGSFTISGTLDSTHASGINVWKAVEEDPSFVITQIGGGVMADFGRATKVLIDGEGPLHPMNRARWRSSREDDWSGGVGQGDRYIIEGEPPEIKFEITPTSNKTVVMHYLRAPTRVLGDDDIQMPWPFHSLLRWTARTLMAKQGPAEVLLSGNQDILAELNRLKAFTPDTVQPLGIRPLVGVLPGNVVAAVPGAAVESSRFEDFN